MNSTSQKVIGNSCTHDLKDLNGIKGATHHGSYRLSSLIDMGCPDFYMLIIAQYLYIYIYVYLTAPCLTITCELQLFLLAAIC